jgi:predicted carbohydrate-binding protein with CBM5 and CBM33 domain
MRHIIPKIKAEGVMPTSMTPINGANVISKAGTAHVMEGSVLQIVVATVVDNAVPTRKWSSLEVTSGPFQRQFEFEGPHKK